MSDLKGNIFWPLGVDSWTIALFSTYINANLLCEYYSCMNYSRFCYPNHRLRGASDVSAGEGLGGTGEGAWRPIERMLLRKLEEYGVKLEEAIKRAKSHYIGYGPNKTLKIDQPK